MTRSVRLVVCVVLLSMLATTFSRAAEGQSSQSGNLDFGADKALLIVGAVAAGVIVTLIIVHQKFGKQTVTGCVNTSPDGVGLLSEKDKHFYVLSDATAGIKPGERMTLKISKDKAKSAGGLVVWKPRRILADAGACQSQASVY